MARKWEIEKHPQRDEIVKALINGVTYREIGAQYGVSSSTLSKYLRTELSRKVSLVKREQDILDGTFVLDNAARAAKSLRKLLTACDVYLQNPDDPEAFEVGPRADDVDVVVQHYDEDDKPAHAERKTLQQLINRVEKGTGGTVMEIRYTHTDPRALVVSTANAINRQLAVLAKIREQAMGMSRDDEARRHIVEGEVWEQLTDVILESTKDNPDVRNKIARGLESIRVSAAGG